MGDSVNGSTVWAAAITPCKEFGINNVVPDNLEFRTFVGVPLESDLVGTGPISLLVVSEGFDGTCPISWINGWLEEYLGKSS